MWPLGLYTKGTNVPSPQGGSGPCPGSIGYSGGHFIMAVPAGAEAA